MADEVNANINVNIDTSQALEQLKNLQRQISQFHTSIARSSATASAAQRALQTDFINAVNATGKFAAELRTIKSASESFTDSLERNKFSMGEYFRYAGAASKTFGRLFRGEFDTIQKVAEDRVKQLQTQYIKMGRDASGALKAISVTPLTLDMDSLATKTMIAAQKQQLFNELISKGTTNLINFGKNTQWAGRQLMVGFTIPLSIFGSQASKAFMDIEQQALRFKRVYGDLFTTQRETQIQLDAIRGLAAEYTKYGVAVKDTMALAADAAAAGMRGAQLQETVRQSTKLSVLGEVDKQQAFQATISLQTAFQMSNDQLAQSIDFLNAVENQSVVSLQDMTDAIPRVAPVIRGLGGDVKDLAVFMAAMKEGGVDAASAANGLKSALGSLINPSKAAKEMLQGVGIDLQGIVSQNQGNLMRTVIALGDAMKELAPLARQRILEQLFGKYQFARVSALFDNIARSGSQAQQVMELVGLSAQDLSRISQKELSAIEENATTKFKGAVESLKTAIAPVGEIFLKIATPIIQFLTKVADKFNGLSDNTKQVVAVVVTVLGAIAPVVLMLVGLFANFAGQMGKFFALIRNAYLKLTGQSQILGEQTSYLTSKQIEEAAVAASLDQIHSKLVQTFSTEATAVNELRDAYIRAAAAAETFILANPGAVLPGKMPTRKKMATGGIVSGPGTGTSDSIPAMLSNGEAVIPAKQTQKYGSLINGIIADNIPGFSEGRKGRTGKAGTNVRIPGGFSASHFGGSKSMSVDELLALLGDRQDAMAISLREMVEGIEDTTKPLTVFTNEVVALSSELNEAVGKTGSGKKVAIDVARNELTSAPHAAVRDIELQRQLEAAGVSIEDIKDINEKITDEIKNGFTKLGDRTEVTAEDLDKLITDAYTAVAKTDDRVKAAYENMKEVTTVTDPNVLARRPTTKESYIESRRNKRGTSVYYSGMERMVGEGNVPYTKEAQFRITNKMGDSLGLSSKDAAKVYKQFSNEVKLKLSTLRGDISAFTAEFEKQAELAGLKTGNAYKVGVDKSGLKDIYVESRQRKSPHDLSAPDGEQDGVAYENARQKAVKRKRKKSKAPVTASGQGAGGTGDGGVFIVNQNGSPEDETPKGTNKNTTRFGKIASRFSGMRGIGAASAASGLAIGASMMPGPVGDIAQKIMPAIMGIQALSMALPLLTNPIGALAVGLGGLAFLIHKTNQAYQQHIQAVKDSAKAEVARKYGSMSAIESYAAHTGTSLPSSRQFNRVGSRTFISADATMQEGFTNYYKSDLGKLSRTSIVKAKDKESAIAMDIAKRAVLSNLSPKQIGANIKSAAELAGGANEVDIQAKLQKMLAPNGKDILKEPLTIQSKIEFLKSDTTKQISALKTQIDNIGKIPAIKTDTNKMPGVFAGPSAGGQAAQQAGNIDRKNKDKVLRDTTIASELAKNAFLQQREALAQLNAAYVDGTITEKEYNAQHAEMMKGFDGIGSSISDLITRMNEVDKSGKTSKALLSDLADSVLADFTKTNKATSKIVKKTLSEMPKKMETQLIFGLANGSLEPLDIIKINDVLNGMKGKTIEEKLKMVADVKGTDAVKAHLRLLILTKAYQDALEKGFSSHNAKAALEKLKAEAEAALNEANKVDKDKNKPNGTKDISDPNATKAQSSFLDAIVKKMRDAYFANQKLTEGFGASSAALKKMMAQPLDMKKGLESKLMGMGAGKSFTDMILGLNPEEFNKAKTLFFTFSDKANTKINGLKAAAINLNKVLNTMLIGDYIKQQQQVIDDTGNKVKVLNILLSKGVSYKDALTQVQGMSSETLSALANTSKADKAWTDLKQVIIDTNNLLKMSPDAAAQKIESMASDAIAMIDAQAAVIRAQAEVGQLVVKGVTINLEADRKAVEAAQNDINTANDLIDAEQRKIDKNNHLIDTLQHQIDVYQETARKLYDIPLENLQSESNILSNALSQIDHQAKSINEQYDAQQKAMEEMNRLNQDAIQQGKTKMSIADALTRGDIAAAAQAAEELRSQQAAAQAGAMQSAMDASRKLAIDSLSVNGMTRAQIEERQYQIGQESFKLEQARDAFMKANVLPLENQIRDIQNDNYVIQQKIYNLQVEQLIPAQDRLKKAQDTLTAHENIVKQIIEDIKYAGQTKAEWELVRAKAQEVYLKILAIGSATLDAAAAARALAEAYAAAAAAAAAIGAGGGGGGGGGTQFTNGTTSGEEVLTGIETATTNKQVNTALSNVDVTTVNPNKVAQTMATTLINNGTSTPAALSAARYTGQALLWAQQQQAALNAATSGGGGAYGGNGAQFKAKGGIIAKYFALGGFARGTDTVPAMLTPGEFIVNKVSTQKYRPLLESINSMNYPNFSNQGRVSISNTKRNINAFTDNSSEVYNYKIDININGSDSDPNNIATAVLNKIKQLENHNIRRRIS